MATIAVPLGAQGELQEAEAVRRPALSDYLRWSVDHKIIGVQYGVAAFIFFMVGGAMAMLIRLELWTPDLDVMVSGAAYNSLFTIHGTIMIFLFIIPMWAAFGNFVVPLQLGAKDMAFPWLNAFAFWLIPPAAVVVLLGYFVSPAEAGWTSYPPLSTLFSGDGQTLWALGAHLLGISSIMGSINFIVTIFNMRPPEMTIWRMPLLCWAVLATSIIAVMATPFLAGALTLLLLDRVAGTTFFDAAGGGDVLLWQNIFWFYSHPAVYIMVLPGMGVLSEVLSVHSRKPVFGYRMVGLSSMGIAFVGFTVWAHHMFTSLQPELRIPFMITTMIIAVPTGIKMFSWLGTIWGGKIRFTSAMLFALGFLSLFVIGGISGVMLAALPFDIHVHDTYFVVSHFHFVLFGGSVFACLRRALSLVPQGHGPHDERAPGSNPLSLHLLRLPLHFLPHARCRHVGHAPARRRLCRGIPALESVDQLLRLCARLFELHRHLQRHQILLSRPHRRRQSLARS